MEEQAAAAAAAAKQRAATTAAATTAAAGPVPSVDTGRAAVPQQTVNRSPRRSIPPPPPSLRDTANAAKLCVRSNKTFFARRGCFCFSWLVVVCFVLSGLSGRSVCVRARARARVCVYVFVCVYVCCVYCGAFDATTRITGR